MTFNFNIGAAAAAPTTQFNFAAKPAAPAAGGTFAFGGQAAAAPTTPGTAAAPKPGGFNFAGTTSQGIGGAFAFGAPAAQKDAPVQQKQALGLSCFNEPQAQRQTNELEYLSSQLRGNGCFQAVFMAPKPVTAATTTTTSSFAFGAKPAASTAQKQVFNRNYDPDHLEGQSQQGMDALLKKGQQTVLDSKKVIKDATDGMVRLQNVLEMQQLLLREAGNQQTGQNILKTDFFRRFQLQNYAADARISQMVTELKATEDILGKFQSGASLDAAEKKRIGLIGMQQENTAIDLLRRTQQ